MQCTICLENSFFLLFWAAEKGKNFTFQWNLTSKRGKFIFNHHFSPSFDELLCSPIVVMNHLEPMVQDLPFYCTKKVPKIHNQFFHFCHGGGTHFLVLAQTLIYCNLKWLVANMLIFPWDGISTCRVHYQLGYPVWFIRFFT